MGESYPRVVQEVIDGDTFKIEKPIEDSQYVRLADVEAPEEGKPYYKKATRRLRGMVKRGKKVTIKPVGTSYDRVVAEVYADNKSVNERMNRRMYK